MSAVNQCQKCNRFLYECGGCRPKTPEQAFASSEEGYTRIDIERQSIIGMCVKCRNSLGACTCRPAKEWLDKLEKELEEKEIKKVVKQTTVLDLIADIATLVETTPNDMELGAEVRKLFIQ